jgi:hypothetical protein
VKLGSREDGQLVGGAVTPTVEPERGDPPPAGVQPLAEQLVAASGGAVRAIVLYGSHQLGTNPDRHSAVDFMVVVEEYRPFYEAMTAAGELHRPPWLMAAMANLLPPNVTAFTPEEGRAGIAKCLIVSSAHLERALGPQPPDHFLLGRLVQSVGLVWTASATDAAWLRGQLAGARSRVLDWMAPYLDEAVDAPGLGRRMMEVCYRGELRPEARDRSARIFEAQAEHFRRTLQPVLEGGAAAGLLERREGGSFVLSAKVRLGQRLKWRWHFLRSKVRSTLRWFKHMVTFANWLPYVVRKVERHTGRPIELTTLERRLPLIFLWPRAIKVLLTRPPKQVSP